MRIDNTIRSQIQSTAESAASSSASSSEEKTSTETSASSQSADTIEKADPNSDSAIRSEVAAALGVSENDPAVSIAIATTVAAQRQQEANDAASANANDGQQAKAEVSVEAQINEARNAFTNGVREETTVKIGNNEGRMFKETVPSASGDIADAVVRSGIEYTEHGFFGDKTTRNTLYRDPTGHAIGRVTSIIEDGIERITKVTNYEPGAISLKVGDTRNVPDPTNGLAGKKPITWDPQPDGRYGTTTGASSSSSSSSSSSPSGSQSSSGGPAATGGIDHTPVNDGSNTTSSTSGSSGDGAVSDPSEWAAWPGSSSDSGNSGVFINATDVREDGSVLITTSDGQSHEFANFDDAASWTKENTQAPPASTGGSSGDDGDTHTSVEGDTSVEVEAPESEGTKINEGEDDKYYAWGEGGALDYGQLPPESGSSIGKESISSASGGSGGYKAAESSGTFVGNPLNVVENIAYFDRAGMFDQKGGVTDGSRPDMEDSSAREQPYEGPGFGVIDSTPEVDDYSTAFRDPNDNLNFAGRGGDPVNPDNPIPDARPDGGPPSTDPQSHDT